MRTRTMKLAVMTSLAGLLLAGCAGSAPGEGGSEDGRGPFTLARGKDTSGHFDEITKLWNKKHPDEKVNVIELSEAADQQRASMVQNLQAKSGKFDLLFTDVIWTAEFAAHGWIEPLDESRYPLDDMLAGPVKTGYYDGKLYALPYNSNGGLLFYRKDLVKEPPQTWDELVSSCTIAEQNNMDCYAGQHAKYEGLTVNVSEAIHAAGGRILSDDGKQVLVDSPEAAEGLQFLVDGFQRGYIPKEAITYQEEQGRRAFQAGDLLYLRNWPYVYGLAQTEGGSKVKGKFGVAPLPASSGSGASTLGGYNLALNKYSDAKASVQDFMRFAVSEQVQRMELTQQSHAPVIASLYDEPALAKKFPYLPTLKESIATAEPRPVTPYYNEMTLAIEEETYAALQGEKSVDEAQQDLKAELERIVAES
ncbi:MAG: ABC transporter substrate-binding protein [Carbonactinosporaceae bacterium]